MSYEPAINNDRETKPERVSFSTRISVAHIRLGR